MKRTTLAFGLEGSTELFYDLVMLFKSFQFSYHKVAERKCSHDTTREVFISPDGKEHKVITYQIFEEVVHL